MLKRVVLIALAAALFFPLAVFADGVHFSSQLGVLTDAEVSPGQWVVTTGLNPSQLYVVGLLSGNPPQVYSILPYLGTISLTSGIWNSAGGDYWNSVFFPGGSLVVTGNSTFTSKTGIAAGDLFTGSFVGTQTLHWDSLTAATFSGAILGEMNPALLAYLSLPDPEAWAGGLSCNLFVTLDMTPGGIANITSIDMHLQPIPEPGTLALFGTGLIGLAGVLRRRLKA